MSEQYTVSVDNVDEDFLNENIESYGFDTYDVGGGFVYAEAEGSKGRIELDGYSGDIDVVSDVELSDFDLQAIEEILSGNDVPVSIDRLVDEDVGVPDEWSEYEDMFQSVAEDSYTPTCSPGDGHRM